MSASFVAADSEDGRVVERPRPEILASPSTAVQESSPSSWTAVSATAAIAGSSAGGGTTPSCGMSMARRDCVWGVVLEW